MPIERKNKKKRYKMKNMKKNALNFTTREEMQRIDCELHVMETNDSLIHNHEKYLVEMAKAIAPCVYDNALSASEIGERVAVVAASILEELRRFA